MNYILDEGMQNRKRDGFQEKLLLYFKEYIESLDDEEEDERFNTDKGFAMSEFSKFLEHHRFNIPDWIEDYYENKHVSKR